MKKILSLAMLAIFALALIGCAPKEVAPVTATTEETTEVVATASAEAVVTPSEVAPVVEKTEAPVKAVKK